MSVVAEPEVRLAALWRLVSLGFAPPTAETVAEVELLAESILELERSPEVDEVLAAARGPSIEVLAAQFHGLFGGTVRVSPYEGSYELDPIRQGRQMSDIAAFYRAFGASPDGPAAERPDHVGCELEFLAFLELRRLAAVESGDDVQLLDDIGASFLRDHAGRWLPAFFSDVRQSAVDAPFYLALAALGARLIVEELERRGIEPPALSRTRYRLPVEADSFECGVSGGDPARSGTDGTF